MNHSCNGATHASRFPWAIVRQLPNMQRITVVRLRNRSDAEGHLTALRRLIPQAEFKIVFDLTGQ